MSKPLIKIAVVSDVVCPWCYIGKRRMEKAVQQLSGEMDFEIAYYPFELNPDMPLAGANHRVHLSNKFGGEEEYQRITNHVADVAAGEGLTFNFTDQTTSPNTRNAHRLILFAKEQGKHLQLVEAFFKAYFTDGVDLTNNDNLVSIAVSTGLDKTKVEEFLNSSTGSAEVQMAETELQRAGVRGVPFYIINDKYGISGAQASETFVQAFKNISQELQTAATGEVCNVDDKNC
jgi:predicted DsbA family dithiol-disulfide isomerase